MWSISSAPSPPPTGEDDHAHDNRFPGGLTVELHTAFLPEEAGPLDGRVAVVIDVLRATTSLLVLIERGCAEVVVTPSVEAARQYGQLHADVLTAGERDGLAPPGFDFGNSPVAFSQAALAGRRMVFATTNGTRAVCAANDAHQVLIGCLRNCVAVARAAKSAGRDMTLLCAGREGRFSLDDAYTAGAIVDAMTSGSRGRGTLDLSDGSLAARALYQSGANPLAVLRNSLAGRRIVEIGLPEDLTYCAERDRSAVVPKVGDRIRVLAV